MSGFDKDWLALREPADAMSRDPLLVAQLSNYLEQLGPTPSLLDIGCGTGSTWRSLHAAMPDKTRWQLLDYDPALLAEAQRQIGTDVGVSFHRLDLSNLANLDLAGVHVLTASAFFDLSSETFCQALVSKLSSTRCGLYAALNYDGALSWTIAHSLDPLITRDFNRHQETDKGFGPALGPAASATLLSLLEGEGYRVSCGESPWLLGPRDEALQRAFLAGLPAPVTEIGMIPQNDVSRWMSFRENQITDPRSSCRVGHLDLLALPN